MELRSTLYGTRRTTSEIALLGVLCCMLGTNTGAQAAPKIELRIGVVTPAATPAANETSSLRGIRLGAKEARQTAQLFGDAIEVYEASGDGRTRGASQAAAFLSSQRKVDVLVGISAADADALSRFAQAHRLIFLNVASRSDSLRAACRRYSFHIQTSDAMRANAWRLFTRGSSARPPRSSGAGQGDVVVLWHPGLERFGAGQLNDRYRAYANAPMDGFAWAGWAAIKIASEAALRAQSGRAEKILAYLESPTSQFDGHKGWQLSFRSADHQLRQPVYIVVPASPARNARRRPAVVDVPDLRAISSSSAGPSTNDVLDRLMSGTNLRCQWSSP